MIGTQKRPVAGCSDDNPVYLSACTISFRLSCSCSDIKLDVEAAEELIKGDWQKLKRLKLQWNKIGVDVISVLIKLGLGTQLALCWCHSSLDSGQLVTTDNPGSEQQRPR